MYFILLDDFSVFRILVDFRQKDRIRNTSILWSFYFSPSGPVGLEDVGPAVEGADLRVPREH